MSDYSPNKGIAPIDRVTPPTVVSLIQPVASVDADVGTPLADKNKASALDARGEEQLASAAEYAEAHAKIAAILAGARSSGQASVSRADTEDAIASLLPARVVIVPLPPASKEMVERAEEVARDMASRVAQSRSAHAHIKSGTIDQILSTVV